jgi:hypothetical protein
MARPVCQLAAHLLHACTHLLHACTMHDSLRDSFPCSPAFNIPCIASASTTPSAHAAPDRSYFSVLRFRVRLVGSSLCPMPRCPKLLLPVHCIRDEIFIVFCVKTVSDLQHPPASFLLLHASSNKMFTFILTRPLPTIRQNYDANKCPLFLSTPFKCVLQKHHRSAALHTPLHGISSSSLLPGTREIFLRYFRFKCFGSLECFYEIGISWYNPGDSGVALPKWMTSCQICDLAILSGQPFSILSNPPEMTSPVSSYYRPWLPSTFPFLSLSVH